MDNVVLPVKGKLSPEYKTILRNLSDLASVLDLPINNNDAFTMLAEAELIALSGNASGRNMITSVLDNVDFDAMNFYKFLAVLQNLSKTEEIFPNLHREFYDQTQQRISSDVQQVSSIKYGAAILTFSRQQPYVNSVNSGEFTGKFYCNLEQCGCNPWMDTQDLDSGDYSSITAIYKMLDECKAVVPIITRGYARSLWCMRELYYATYKKSTQIYSVAIEDGWEREQGGKWLANTLRQMKMHLKVNPTDELKMAKIASNIAMGLDVPPRPGQNPPDMTNPKICKQIDRMREQSGESGSVPPGNDFHDGKQTADETGQENDMASPGLKDAATIVMGFKEACHEISAAIAKGAPTFNKGDHKGSFEIYKQTAEKILQHCSVTHIQQKLCEALDLATKQSNFTKRAWTIRNAFDAIVSADTDTSNSSDSELEEMSPPIKKYEQACRELAAAAIDLHRVLTEIADKDSDEPSVKED